MAGFVSNKPSSHSLFCPELFPGHILQISDFVSRADANMKVIEWGRGMPNMPTRVQTQYLNTSHIYFSASIGQELVIF